MNPSDVLFVGGDVKRLASVKIRCQEVAARLGCDTMYGVFNPNDIPANYKAFICVKPDFGREGVQTLKKKGVVVWDVLDSRPPQDENIVYLTSTTAAAVVTYPSSLRFLIPHYHCNFERTIGSGESRQIGYVGSIHWDPLVEGIRYTKFYTDRWTREDVVAAYSSIGLAINLRYMGAVHERFLAQAGDQAPQPTLHVAINSGMKLINCMGFGLPSVCSYEPGYVEHGRDCALFGDSSRCVELLRSLVDDHDLYNKLRRNCLSMSCQFHIDEIVHKYRSMIASL